MNDAPPDETAPSDGEKGAAFVTFAADVAKLVERPELVATLSEKARAQYLLELATHRKQHGALAQWMIAADHVRQLCGLTTERFTSILSLASGRDMRLALRWTPQSPRPRTGDERIYPTSGWISDYMDLHGGIEAPYAFHFWSAVAAVGAAARNNFYLEWNFYPVYPFHYVMIVGESGGGKSTAIDQAEDLLHLANEQLEQCKDASGQEHTINIQSGDGSPEGFCSQIKVRPGRNESTGVIINDEVIGMLGNAQFAGDRWMNLLLKLYTKRKYTENTRKYGTYKYANIAVSALFGSAPDLLRTYCTPAMFTGGWVGRCIFVERPTDPELISSRPPVIDPVQRHRLASELAELSLAPETELTPTPEADRWYDAWYVDYKRKLENDWLMNGWNNRKRVHVLKLGLVIALSERHHGGVLRVEHLEQAAAILAVEEARLPETFGRLLASNESSQVSKLVEMLRKPRYSAGLLWGDAVRLCKFFRSSTEMRQVVDAAIESGAVYLTLDPKGRGRFLHAGPRPADIPWVDPPPAPSRRKSS